MLDAMLSFPFARRSKFAPARILAIINLLIVERHNGIFRPSIVIHLNYEALFYFSRKVGLSCFFAMPAKQIKKERYNCNILRIILFLLWDD
jgi:hypothetical protein